MMRKFVIRTDASIKIGSGHVMRCLAIAIALREKKIEVVFISRLHPGHLNKIIRDKGFLLYELSEPKNNEIKHNHQSLYHKWLGLTEEEDKNETIEILKDISSEWLIVDHYGLSYEWEKGIRPFVKRIAVIDDLANRQHDCDLLLDQNWLIEKKQRYEGLVPPNCTKLLGPEYALLRPEFVKARETLKPRSEKIRRIFVFFGASDLDNLTGMSLRALCEPRLIHLEVDVIIGAKNPHRYKIKKLVEKRLQTHLHIQVNYMAELMAQADLALCAGGTITWERLCLGLPGLVITTAENQVPFTRDLHKNRLLNWIGTSNDIDMRKIQSELQKTLKQNQLIRHKSTKGMNLVDGRGVERAAQHFSNETI